MFRFFNCVASLKRNCDKMKLKGKMLLFSLCLLGPTVNYVQLHFITVTVTHVFFNMLAFDAPF